MSAAIDSLNSVRCVALAGGVGGAKLSQGLYQLLAPGQLTVIVNSGDDFDHLGLRICPDLDTVMYTLAGLANPDTGWGLAGDTWQAMQMLGRLQADTWFQLGDRDLATHIYRTQLLSAGESLTAVTRRLCEALEVSAAILPMTDNPVRTFITTSDGEVLPFQDYFVRRAHRDAVGSISFRGMEDATLTKAAAAALLEADVIVFCPSNPFVSIGPILSTPGTRAALAGSRAQRVAVSPLVGGRALRGPAADMMKTLGHEVSVAGLAQLYRDVADILVIDHEDSSYAAAVKQAGMEPLVTSTIMHGPAERKLLADVVIRSALQAVGQL